MDIQEPIPLIPWDDEPDDIQNELESHGWNCSLGFWGYSLLLASWMLFLVSTNTIFEVWRYVIYPLSLDPRTQEFHSKLMTWCSIFDKYVMRFWSIYIVTWWWSIVSWCGIKLFRHSKGIQS